MSVWSVVWLGMMIIVLFSMMQMIMAGEMAPALFMFVWLCCAGFGLYKGIQGLKKLLLFGKSPGKPTSNQTWNDDVSDQDA